MEFQAIKCKSWPTNGKIQQNDNTRKWAMRKGFVTRPNYSLHSLIVSSYNQ